MSKVDLSVFEEVKVFLGYDDVDRFIFECCEGDLDLGNAYVFENEYPSYSLSKSDPQEYDRLVGLYRTELGTKYQKHVDSVRQEIGYNHLEQDGGGEGGAEYCHGVFELKGKVYKAEYSYYSFNGYEYGGICDTLKEAKPVQKTITVYE